MVILQAFQMPYNQKSRQHTSYFTEKKLADKLKSVGVEIIKANHQTIFFHNLAGSFFALFSSQNTERHENKNTNFVQGSLGKF